MNFDSVYLCSAIAGGVVLFLQLGMMLLGMDDGFEEGGGDVAGADGDIDGVDGSTDSAGFWFFEMISIRTLAAALTFFGLVGGAANSTGAAPGVSLALGALAGYGAMYSVYWAFKQLFRLETSGNEDVMNAIGKPGEVYVPIAASGQRAGKVHVSLQGRTVEYQALTDSDQLLPTGAKVIVTDVVANDTVKVELQTTPT